nr:hypothetical protein [Paenibacillus kribbensis]
MAFIQRHATNQTGAVTFTGNTLGLARSNSAAVTFQVSVVSLP